MVRMNHFKLQHRVLLLILGVVCWSYVVLVQADPVRVPRNIPPPVGTKVQLVDKIIAIVNDKIITESQWRQAVIAARQQLKASATAAPSARVLRRQVLDQLILKSLQLQMASRAGIKITATQVNNALQSIAQKNNATLSQLRDQVEASGMNYRNYRQRIRDQLTIMQLQRVAVGQSINVTSQEVNTAMLQLRRTLPLQYHLGDILIPLPETPTAPQLQAGRSKAQHIATQLRQPRANFKKIAAANSANSQAFKGGDMGWLTLTDMPEVFVPVVKKLPLNGVSQPFRAPNGFHILKLFARKPISKKISKAQVEAQLRQRKFQESLALWLQQLRDTAYVKVMVPEFKSLGSG